MRKQNQALKKIWNTTNPPIPYLVIGIFFSLCNTVTSLVIPLVLKNKINELLYAYSFKLLIPIILLFFVQIISMSISLYLLSYVGQKIVHKLRMQSWDNILKLPISFFHKNKSGEIVSRMTNDTNSVVNLLSNDIAELCSALLSLVGSIIILFFLDTPMTLILLTIIPILLFIVMPLGKKLQNISYIQQEKTSELTGILTQVLSEIKLIKSYNAENYELKRGQYNIDSLFQNSLKKAKIEALLVPLINAVMSMCILFIIGFGAYRLGQGYISSGELLAFVLYLFQIMIPVLTISKFITNIHSVTGATERLFEILEEEPEYKGHSLKKEHTSTGYEELEIEKLSFSYNQNDTLLRDISFKVKPCTMTAIVGPSGAGKTTLFSLLERFYLPTEGQIKVNGISHKDIDIYQWRKMFSYVSQDCPILSGTVRDNILYGNDKEISDDEMIEFCKMANAHDFILNLPNGYDSILGERGVNLSGGQKQRIAIARALIRNAPFLLLDEVTANLDSQSENIIKGALDILMQNRTTIVIAHRISTIQNADQIIVLKDGSIVGMGTHEYLLKENIFYNSLVNQKHKNTFQNV